MSFWRKRIVAGLRWCAFACLAMTAQLPSATADIGDRVSNTAIISQDAGAGTLSFPTNTAEFTIQARRTPSDIEFFRIVQNAPDSIRVSLNGSDFSPSGELNGPFRSFGAVSLFQQKPLDTSSPVQLVPAQSYFSGELIVVRVVDAGQNGNSDRIETVAVTITADSGDEITLRLYEDQPDSGHFYGFFPSTAGTTPRFDGTLTAPQNAQLTATYIDAFDATEVSVDTAFIDPFGRVFDSTSGVLLDGANVTIIDAVTGQPADVMAIDGSGSFPSTVESGASVADSNGISYQATPGSFFFPILPPGRYRLMVDTPPGYDFPSSRSAGELQNLPNAPFDIWADASFAAEFEVTTTGPVSLDIPLDPATDLNIAKRASVAQASIGDFVGYTVDLENAGALGAPVLIQDSLPTGFRYSAGSLRINGAEADEPVISATGDMMTIAVGVLSPGERVQLTYLTSIGPNAPLGEAVNTVVATNGGGAAVSNRADAAVYIEEDLLTSRLTIVGRVAEAACRPDDAWARSILDGDGVPGVRLYMETGRYVVTDENGQFHFEGIRPGTHVVQVDEATLPAGYEPVICEENTRYAGSALSKFVDAQGGSIWRANFYLRRTDAVSKPEVLEVAKTRDEDLYDKKWLNAQTPSGLEWVYPVTDQTPQGRSVNLGLLHEPKGRVRLDLNGRPVPGLNYSGKDLSATREVAISRWAGVDIQRGENVFVARLYDAEGELIEQSVRKVWFVDEVSRASHVDDQSILVADGRTKPRIAIRLEDGDGNPVHEGRRAEISVADPYRLAQEAEEEFESPVNAAFSAVSGVRVGANGVAYVELEPTLESGRVRLQVLLQDGSYEDIDVWLAPEKRDWIVVGVAEIEGMATELEDAQGRRIDELSSDGRVAFFAKGVIKGDWLLTLAVDTAKRRGGQDREVFDEIDPNAYYTLYGDRTWQYNNAESQYPVYVKLEKNTFQAVFGDYETGFTETELGRYTRRLSGLKADYESEDTSFTAFASETNQSFIKDEIAADGTSGPFRLSVAPLVRSSEIIKIETRDRLRPDLVVGERLLNRYSDYEIDYTTGELFFRQPVSATDAALNPNVIVIDYETSEAAKRGITAGIRAEKRFLDGAVQAGATLIHEEDAASLETNGSNLVAADLTLRLSDRTEVRAEVAKSDVETDAGTKSADAVLLVAQHRTEKLLATGYIREEEEGFGLGQQVSSTNAIRRIGAELSAEIGSKINEDGSDRSERRVTAQAYQETNLSQGSQREVADLVVQQESQTFGVSAGVRAVSEDFGSVAEPRQSLLLLAGLRKTFVDQGLSVSAVWEKPIQVGGETNDEASLFPGRAVFGADKTLGKRVMANLRHEITNGAAASGQNTVAGLTWEPTGGTQVRASTDMITSDSGRRIGATVGVDQVWRVNDAWTLGGGFARRSNVDGDDQPLDVTADAAVSPLEDGVRSPLTQAEAYTSAYFGASYQTESMAGSARLEARDSSSGQRLVAVLGGAREITKTLSFSAAARHQDETLNGQPDLKETDVRIGAVWRPKGEGLVVLNRLDIGQSTEEGVQDRSKIVNNLAVNAMVTDQTQVSLYHGVKHVDAEFEGAAASGTTHLIGAELRHDVSKTVDLGLQTTWSSNDGSGTQAWSFGPSIGVTPKENIWVSVGYNVSGFEDEDFEAAKYRSEGPYIKLRAKFDQNTAKNVLQSLGFDRG